MMNVKKIMDLYFFHPKSKIKAGEGLDKGKYPFYTSSAVQSKWLNEFAFNTKALVFGTGGKASLHFVDGMFSISTDCFALSSKQEEVDIKYTYYYLSYNFFLIERGFRGAGLQHLSKEYIGNIEITYPDLETQNKIVAILDKSQAIRDKKEETILKNDKLPFAIFLDMFGDPIKNPMGWNKLNLKELGEWKAGGTPSRNRQMYFRGNIPWVTSGELNEVFVSSTNENITQEGINDSNAKLIPVNSLLIGMYDTAALKSSINTVPLTCNQAIAYSQIDTHKCNLLYLYTALQIGKEYFKSGRRGGRQQNLNLTMIKEISIPNPPIELQIKFEAIFLKYLEIKKRQRSYMFYLNDLFNSLSQLAFKGELGFGSGIDLEILLRYDYQLFKKKSTKSSIQLLLDRMDKDELNPDKFYEPDIYDKARTFIYELLKEKKIIQVFDEKTQRITLKLNETAKTQNRK